MLEIKNYNNNVCIGISYENTIISICVYNYIENLLPVGYILHFRSFRACQLLLHIQFVFINRFAIHIQDGCSLWIRIFQIILRVWNWFLILTSGMSLFPVGHVIDQPLEDYPAIISRAVFADLLPFQGVLSVTNRCAVATFAHSIMIAICTFIYHIDDIRYNIFYYIFDHRRYANPSVTTNFAITHS